MRISGLDPSEIQPGSPYHQHAAACEMGYQYGPWTDCNCMERMDVVADQLCADMGCKHPRKSHTEWGQCSEKRAFYNERLYGYEQPVIYKTCGCRWKEAAVPRRPVSDNPQA